MAECSKYAKGALLFKRGSPPWMTRFLVFVALIATVCAQVGLMAPFSSSKDIQDYLSKDSRVRIEVGGYQYLARPVGNALSGNLSNMTSLATVVTVTAGDQIDVQFLRHHVQHFKEDDVFQDEFLNGIIIHGKNESSVVIHDDVPSQIPEWNTTWIEQQFPGDTEKILRPGPYLILSGVPHEVLRIMSDDNKAFVHSTLRPNDAETSSYEADPVGASDGAAGILVPSRLCAQPSLCYPLDGLRIAVKDLFHLDGASTSLNSRAYRRIHPVQNHTASVIDDLVSQGAHVVGKTKMSAFILQEHPTQNVESVSPLNPRGDGYQIPAGSSGGSAAAIAAYDWLDLALGTDGTMRIPALANGIFGLRMTTGVLPVDGIVRLWERYDALGAFARDLGLLRRLARSWLRQPHFATQQQQQARASPPFDDAPLQILYFEDFVPVVGEEQSKILEDFAEDFARYGRTQVRRISIADHWAANPAEDEADLAAYLHNATAHGFYYAAFHAFDEFRATYQQRYHERPFISECVRWIWHEGSTVTLEQHGEMVRRLDVFRDWFTYNFLSANVIAVLPIAEAKPNYRDECQTLPQAPTSGLRNTDLSPILGAPELAVPIAEIEYWSRISGNIEVLPVAASLMGAPHMDLALIETVLDFFNASGRPTAVKTGKRMF